MTYKTTPMLIAGAVSLACALAAPAALAGSKTVDKTRANGGSVHTQWQHEQGYAQRSVERVGAQGRTMNGSRERSYDAQTGSYSAEQSRSYTGLNGQTANRSRTVERTDSGATVTREGSGPQGQSWSYARSQGDGHKEVTYTGPQGQTASHTRDIVNNGDGTLTVQQAATGLNGESRSRTRTYDLPQTP